MTPFDLFQQATCEIAEGDREAAAATLAQALGAIRATGVDAEMEDDLRRLRDSIVTG